MLLFYNYYTFMKNQIFIIILCYNELLFLIIGKNSLMLSTESIMNKKVFKYHGMLNGFSVDKKHEIIHRKIMQDFTKIAVNELEDGSCEALAAKLDQMSEGNEGILPLLKTAMDDINSDIQNAILGEYEDEAKQLNLLLKSMGGLLDVAVEFPEPRNLVNGFVMKAFSDDMMGDKKGGYDRGYGHEMGNNMGSEMGNEMGYGMEGKSGMYRSMEDLEECEEEEEEGEEEGEGEDEDEDEDEEELEEEGEGEEGEANERSSRRENRRNRRNRRRRENGRRIRGSKGSKGSKGKKKCKPRMPEGSDEGTNMGEDEFGTAAGNLQPDHNSIDHLYLKSYARIECTYRVTYS